MSIIYPQSTISYFLFPTSCFLSSLSHFLLSLPFPLSSFLFPLSYFLLPINLLFLLSLSYPSPLSLIPHLSLSSLTSLTSLSHFLFSLPLSPSSNQSPLSPLFIPHLSLLPLTSLTFFSLTPIHNSRGIIGLLLYYYWTITGLLLYYSYETIGRSICRKRLFRPGSHRSFYLILGLIVSPLPNSAAKVLQKNHLCKYFSINSSFFLLVSKKSRTFAADFKTPRREVYRARQV